MKGSTLLKKERMELQVSIASAPKLPPGLISLADYDIRLIEIPFKSEKGCEGFIGNRLRTIYPWDQETMTFESILQKKPEGWIALVFIMEKEILHRYQERTRHLFSVHSALLKLKKEGDYLLIQDDHLEFIQIQSSFITGVSIFNANNTEGGPLPRSGVYPEGNKPPRDSLDIFLNRIPTSFTSNQYIELIDLSTGLDNPLVLRTTHNLEEEGIICHRLPISLLEWTGRGLFMRKQRFSLLPTLLLVGSFAFFLVSLIHFNGIRAEETAQWLLEANEKIASMEILALEAEQLENRISEDQLELQKLLESKTPQISLFFSELSRLGARMDIDSLNYREGAFTIKAYAANPLELKSQLEAHPLFDDLLLTQITPEESGENAFSLSGRFYGYR